MHFFSADLGDTIKGNIEVTPFNNRYNFQTYGIKGRVLPYILGNGKGVSSLLGFEWGFAKNNSIGLDFLYNGFHDLDDHKPGLSEEIFHRETAAHITFNHYWSLHNLRENRGIVFYSGITMRKGITNKKEERGGTVKDSIINTYKDYLSYGGQIGFIYTPGGRPFAINFNIPIIYNNKTIRYTDSKNPAYNNSQKHSTIDFRLEFNLYWWFTRKDKSIYLQ